LTAASHLETVSLSCEQNWPRRVWNTVMQKEGGYSNVKEDKAGKDESRTEKGGNKNEILTVVWHRVH
jgi:hypothetical protein